MVRKTSITIMGNKELLYEIYNNVKPYIYKPQAKACEFSGKGNLKIILEDETPGLDYIIKYSNLHHLHPHIAQWVHYTKSEIDRLPFFQMLIPDPLEVEGVSAFNYGTQYEGGCPICCLGGKPVGDVLVDRKFVKKYKIGNVRPDIYVSEELKEIIESNILTGVSFNHEMRDYKGRKIPKFYIMSIHNVLPPMSNSTWLDSTGGAKFKDCGHNVVYLHSDVQYEKEKLEDAKDFNLSMEYINNFRLQEIVVSSQVRKIFKEHKIFSFFFPVALL